MSPGLSAERREADVWPTSSNFGDFMDRWQSTCLRAHIDGTVLSQRVDAANDDAYEPARSSVRSPLLEARVLDPCCLCNQRRHLHHEAAVRKGLTRLLVFIPLFCVPIASTNSFALRQQCGANCARGRPAFWPNDGKRHALSLL